MSARLLGLLGDADYVAAWARALLFTEIVEVPIYVALLRVPVAYAALASLLTHPFVWFVFPVLGARLGLGGGATFGASELFAWLVEAAFLARVLPIRAECSRSVKGPFTRRALVALGASLGANTASVALGAASRALFGLP